MIVSLKRWCELAARCWAEAVAQADREEDHREALEDNMLWDEVHLASQPTQWLKDTARNRYESGRTPDQGNGIPKPSKCPDTQGEDKELRPVGLPSWTDWRLRPAPLSEWRGAYPSTPITEEGEEGPEDGGQ